MSEIILDDVFWDELGAINLDEILAEHPAPPSPEGWRDSEDIIRGLHPSLAQLIGRPIYIQADPIVVLHLLWRQSHAYTRGRVLGSTRVLGVASGHDCPHYIIGPLSPDFVARRRNVYPEDYIVTTVPNPLEIINIQNIDFNNDLSYVETLGWIVERAFLGYIQSIPIFTVHVALMRFGIVQL